METSVTLPLKAVLFKCYFLTKRPQDRYIYYVDGRTKPFQAGHKGSNGELDTRDWFETLGAALEHVRGLQNTAKVEDAEMMLQQWTSGNYPPLPMGPKKSLEHYQSLRQHFDLLRDGQQAQSDEHLQKLAAHRQQVPLQLDYQLLSAASTCPGIF